MTIARKQPLPIEDYAIIGDCRTAALVAKDGSIDWLCCPRFDSAACFASLLGSAENGRFHIAPADAKLATRRSYLGPTAILETVWESRVGTVAIIDFMIPDEAHSVLVRIVECRKGRVDMRMELALRFDYGQSIPWVTRRKGGNGVVAVSGPDMVVLRTNVELHGEAMTTLADFRMHAGDRIPFVLTHCESHLPVPPSYDADDALYKTQQFWESWAARNTYRGEWAGPVCRSLMALKCLTHATTGGIVAAATTSLPEELGGVRNWDYRFCWLRDATLTLFSFMACGYFEEAAAWAAWLQRSVAGSPDQLQIMYGIAGERRLEEWEVEGLAGYQGAKPVRIGNAAAKQIQLDVYGEVMGAMFAARKGNLLVDGTAWPLQCAMLQRLTTLWREKDDGIWETRGGSKHFTFSKIMAWVAFARSIDDAETYGLEAPLDEWHATRDAIFADVCEHGFNKKLNSFTQCYGETGLDATALLIPLVGFLPGNDPRVLGTIAAIEKGLMRDGFVLRYDRSDLDDGLPGEEGAFIACSFWLASAKFMAGQEDDARALFERLVALCNDVGLLAEEYDPKRKRFTGNFPQAFSHVALVNTALTLGGKRAHDPESGKVDSSESAAARDAVQDRYEPA